MLVGFLPAQVQVHEVIWTFSVLPCFLYSTHLLKQAAEDFTYLRKNGINGLRDYAAFTTVLLYMSVTFVMAMFVIVGLVSMSARPANPEHLLTRSGTAVTIGFLMAAVVFTVTLYVVEVRRKVLVARIQAAEAEGTDTTFHV